MKQIFYSAAFFAAIFFAGNSASAQYGHRGNDSYNNGNASCNDNQQQSFYYYPQSNVYYSINTQQYIFSYRGSWVVSNRLPRERYLRDEPRFVVNHDGFDVWKDNSFHASRYGNRRFRQTDLAYASPQGRFDERNRNDDRHNDHDRRDDNRRR